jgi:hypothetical protein
VIAVEIDLCSAQDSYREERGTKKWNPQTPIFKWKREISGSTSIPGCPF